MGKLPQLLTIFPIFSISRHTSFRYRRQTLINQVRELEGSVQYLPIFALSGHLRIFELL